MNNNYRSGFVAIVGKPNVGKSTLMNHLIGQKVSITSRKPQTTRHQILGVTTRDTCQIVFVDTPGMHLSGGKALNRIMNRAAKGTLGEVDLILMVVNAGERFSKEDENVLSLIKQQDCPAILVANKIDKLSDTGKLLPFLDELRERHEFAEMVPVSALRSTQLDVLAESICSRLPQQERMYPDTQLTDKSERFVVAELIREQVFRQAGQEVPYSVAVEIEHFREAGSGYDLGAIIYVEKPGQKAILIGKHGARIKAIGIAARESIEKFLGKKVHLETWVKVKEKWSDDARALKSLGYGDGG